MTIICNGRHNLAVLDLYTNGIYDNELPMRVMCRELNQSRQMLVQLSFKSKHTAAVEYLVG
jgi:hypothetical protein